MGACGLALLLLIVTAMPIGGGARGDGTAAPLLAQPLLAQASGQEAPGSVSSTAFHPLPQGLSIKVFAYDDSDTNLEIRERLIEELTRSAYTVSDKAVLELAFESEVVAGDFSVEGPSLGRLEAGTRMGDERDLGVEMEVNVWSSTQDSVLGGRKSRESRRELNRFHVNAVLRDRRSGELLWQGDALCDMATADMSRIIASLAGPLVNSLGRSVSKQPFEIR